MMIELSLRLLVKTFVALYEHYGHATITSVAQMIYDMTHKVNKMIMTSAECWLAAYFCRKMH